MMSGKTSEDTSVEGFAFEDDAFLDRLSGMLNSIVGECEDELKWSPDSDKAFTNLRRNFDNVQQLCHDAGMTRENTLGFVRFSEDNYPISSQIRSPNKDSLVYSLHINHDSPRTMSSEADTDRTTQQLRITTGALSPRHNTNGINRNSSVENMKPPAVQQHHVPLSKRDDIIEVEITDILISTQDEIQRWKHEFRIEMMQQEARRHELNSQHMEQVQALQDELSESKRQTALLARELSATNAKLDALQALTITSQKATEAILKEHSQYWKAICQDLVIEKRTMASRLAEERAKYHSLREHIDMHEQSRPKPSPSRTSPHVKDRYTSPGDKGKPITSNQNDQVNDPTPPSEKDHENYLRPAASPLSGLRTNRGTNDKLLSSIEHELRRTGAKVDVVQPTPFRRYYLKK